MDNQTVQDILDDLEKLRQDAWKREDLTKAEKQAKVASLQDATNVVRWRTRL